MLPAADLPAHKLMMPPCKRRRQNHSHEQTNVLMNWFNANEVDPYPSSGEKDRLSEMTGLDVRQIEHWFTNRRKRSWRTKSLKALREEHRVEYELMVAEHEQQRAREALERRGWQSH